MAEHRDHVMDELRRIRNRLSRRLYAAYKRGRLHEDVVALDAEGMRAYREAIKGLSAGRRKRK